MESIGRSLGFETTSDTTECLSNLNSDLRLECTTFPRAACLSCQFYQLCLSSGSKPLPEQDLILGPPATEPWGTSSWCTETRLSTVRGGEGLQTVQEKGG